MAGRLRLFIGSAVALACLLTASTAWAAAPEKVAFTVGDNEIVFHHECSQDNYFYTSCVTTDGIWSWDEDWSADNGDYHVYPSEAGTYTVREDLHGMSVTHYFGHLSNDLSQLFTEYTEGNGIGFSTGVDVPAEPEEDIFVALYKESRSGSTLFKRKLVDWNNIVEDELVVMFPDVPVGRYKWRVEASSGVTGKWDRFTKKTYSTLSMSASRSKVSYDSRKVTFSGRLLINKKPAKSKYVRLYKNGSFYAKFKTNKYGRVKTTIRAGRSSTEWQFTYSGTAAIDACESSVRTTHGTAYHFYDTGNLLEYPHLHAGHTYQVILESGYRIDLTSPTLMRIHRYGTFTFHCNRTGDWMLYAANRDIFDGQYVGVYVW